MILTYFNMLCISLITGWGLGLGFWSAHLLCKKIYQKGGKRL
jgi:hypothetical protein